VGNVNWLCTVGGNVTGVATVEHSMEVPQKIKTELNMTQQFHFWVSEENKNTNLKSHVYPYVH